MIFVADCLLQTDGHSSRKDMFTMLDALFNALHGGWKGGGEQGGGGERENASAP